MAQISRIKETSTISCPDFAQESAELTERALLAVAADTVDFRMRKAQSPEDRPESWAQFLFIMEILMPCCEYRP